MRKVKFSVEKESVDEMRAAGRFNPGLKVIMPNEDEIPISAGYADYIAVYQDKKGVLVTSFNPGLEYFGAEYFDAGDIDKPLTSIFLQGEGQIAEAFGTKSMPWDLEPKDVVKMVTSILF